MPARHPARPAQQVEAQPRPALRRLPEGIFIHTPFKVGKYLVSPLTRAGDGGRFTAGVSIRSGSGSMTHDRVLRFIPLFDTSDQATRFATEQALAWIGRGACDVHPSNPITQE